jgi:methionyl-tRNA formyltransferase
MEEGMDTGPILLQLMEPIRPDDTAGSLGERLAQLGGSALREACDRIREGAPALAPQSQELATYAPLLSKSDGALSWNRPADQIDRFVRAMDPWPGAAALFRGQSMRLHAVTPIDLVPGEAPPGTIVTVDPYVTVAALPGHVRLVRLQPAGRKSMTAVEWARGTRVVPGERLG